MERPLTQWVCDVCGETIASAREGYAIWRRDNEGGAFDFKLIHHNRCDIRGFPASMALEELLGPRGQSVLLSFLSLGPIMRNNGGGSRPRVKDLDEFVDFFRRVQLPFYEEARANFHEPEILERYSDANEVAPYLPEALERIAAALTR